MSRASSKIFILPTIFLSILWNIPRFNELFTCVRKGNETFKAAEIAANYTIEEYDICGTPMRNNPHYISVYILIANFVIMTLIPIFILTVTNFLIYTTISNISRLNKKTSKRQRRDHSVAMILVGIVIVFILCNVFRMVMNVYEVFHLAYYGDILVWPPW